MAEARKIAMVIWSVSLQNGFVNMLFDPLLQPLGSTTHVLTITVAQELVHKFAIIRSR